MHLFGPFTPPFSHGSQRNTYQLRTNLVLVLNHLLTYHGWYLVRYQGNYKNRKEKEPRVPRTSKYTRARTGTRNHGYAW